MHRINTVLAAAFVVAIVGLAGVFVYGPWPYISTAQEPHFFIAKLAMGAGFLLGMIFAAIHDVTLRKEQSQKRVSRGVAGQAIQSVHESGCDLAMTWPSK